MSKVFWFDVETTGLNPEPVYTKNGDRLQSAIIQFAGLIEIDSVVEREFSWNMRPAAYHTIDPEALKVTGLTEVQIKDFPYSQDALYKTLNVINSKYINKYDKADKFILAGYNIQAFDVRFLRQLFTDFKDNYFGSWYYWPCRDVAALLSDAIESGRKFENFKLKTLCEAYGIEIEAHNPMSDIKATRALYHKLTGRAE